jgi:hypothetical protein
MRRVVASFTPDRDGYYAAVKEMHEQAKRLTRMGLGRAFGVYVDRTLPREHPKRRFAPWAVWVVDK